MSHNLTNTDGLVLADKGKALDLACELVGGAS